MTPLLCSGFDRELEDVAGSVQGTHQGEDRRTQSRKVGGIFTSGAPFYETLSVCL